jgi:hypothetical protein
MIVQPGVADATEGLASSVAFELEDGRRIQWVDETFRAEYGDGATVEVKLAQGIRPGRLGDLQESLRGLAWAILGPTAQPWRELTLVLPSPFLDLSPGDLIAVTHPQVPTWRGTRGLAGALCQVSSVALALYGGRWRATVRVRLSTTALRGWAPCALVGAGGLVALSPDVALDTLSAWGTSGWSADGVGYGGAGTFVAGDKVVLTEMDCSSVSIPDEPFAVVSVATNVVTLDGNPSAAMVALAAAQYKVALRFAGWGTATASQKGRAAYVADDGDGYLGAADLPHRWGA